jgi:uncharacterized Zn finger protein
MRHKEDRGIIKEHLTQQAQITKQSLAKKYTDLQPVIIRNQRIANTPLGKAWCSNLDKLYVSNKNMKLGKRYVLTGAVLSLAYAGGEVHALIQGMAEKPVEVKLWFSQSYDPCGSIQAAKKGVLKIEIDDAREEFVKHAINVKKDLFPGKGDIRYQCKCIEWRQMCWHVASALYGIGNRLDEEPMLLLRWQSQEGIKRPESYFLDTGLAAYQTRWSTAQNLVRGNAGCIYQS